MISGSLFGTARQNIIKCFADPNKSGRVEIGASVVVVKAYLKVRAFVQKIYCKVEKIQHKSR